ncbi:MAG: hypothetical protein AMS18_03345 [Gemmatimonas sp. SG8_17]|nr:MAG: hypothetical protein AMS18_03345 [Gemmatimonas sp. SG8_17]
MLAALLGAAGSLQGQVVMGQVVDSTSGVPVGTGFVVLVDEAGAEVTRALSSGAGRFTLRAPSGGVYRLKSERIGYRAFLSDPFQLAADATIDYTLQVAALPVQLAAVEIQGKDRCHVNPERGAATVVIWEEIRKALAATTWSDEQEVFHYRKYSYQRDLDEHRREVLSERGNTMSGVSEPPFNSIPADRLAAEGYIVARSDGTWYYMPDARVLLDPTFLGTHCFHVVRDPDERPGLVGLAFEPMTDRRLPDVEGTLWLNEATSELRSLEVRHTRLPESLDDSRVGGTVEFMMLPSGAWIVRRWQVRTPVITVVEDSRRLMRRRPTVSGFRDTGGEILAVATRDGVGVFETPLSRVTGEVFDSTMGRPLGTAVVGVAGTDFRAVTDSNGHFDLAAPLEGEYTLVVTHPWLDSIAVGSSQHAVRLSRENSQTASFRIPHVTNVMRRLCGRSLSIRDARVVVGVVRAAGMPIADATVSAQWQTLSSSGARYRVGDVREEVKTDSNGFFALCDIPVGRPVTLTAGKGATSSREASIIFPQVRQQDLLFAWDRSPGQVYDHSFSAPHGLWKVDLDLVARDQAGTLSDRVMLTGMVSDRETGEPLEAALVILNGADTARTRPDGTFDLVDVAVPVGTNRVEFHRRGYEPIGLDIMVDEDDSDVSLSVDLSPLPVGLEEIVVAGEHIAVPEKLVGFFRRRERGRGQFFGPDELERLTGLRITDVIRRARGVDVLRAGSNMAGVNDYFLFSSASSICRTLLQQPIVYVDGMLFDISFLLSIQVEDLAALEIYNGASEVPPEFNRTGSDCGVIVLWTR